MCFITITQSNSGHYHLHQLFTFSFWQYKLPIVFIKHLLHIRSSSRLLPWLSQTPVGGYSYDFHLSDSLNVTKKKFTNLLCLKQNLLPSLTKLHLPHSLCSHINSPGSAYSSFPHLPSNPATSIANSTFTICHKSFLGAPSFFSKFKEDFTLIFFLL